MTCAEPDITLARDCCKFTSQLFLNCRGEQDSQLGQCCDKQKIYSLIAGVGQISSQEKTQQAGLTPQALLPPRARALGRELSKSEIEEQVNELSYYPHKKCNDRE
jgi:hypothetical protein